MLSHRFAILCVRMQFIEYQLPNLSIFLAEKKYLKNFPKWCADKISRDNVNFKIS